jgi:protein phosphatase PTC1
LIVVLDLMRSRAQLNAASPKGSPLCSPDGSPVTRVSSSSELPLMGCPSSEPSNRRRVFAAIYDGHGGRECSAFLRHRLHLNMARELKFRESNMESGEPVDIKKLHADAWLSAYLMTNLQMRRSGIDSGSTSVTCVIDSNPQTAQRLLHIANTGDAAAILCRRQGCEIVTALHRPTCAAERSRVVQNGGVVFQKRLMGVLAVSRAFGNFSLKLRSSGLICRPWTRSVILTEDDQFLVLCCDGVTDVMSKDEIHKCVLNGCDKLVERCRNKSEPAIRSAATKLSRWLVHCAICRGSTDNISAVVIIL